MYDEKIIVRMPNWVGDLVMATPLLSDLRAHFPHISMTAMCPAPLADLLKEDPAIDELFVFHRGDRRFLRREARRDLLGKLQTGQYDVGIVTPRSFSSAFWFWQAGVKRRIGFGGRWRRWFLTDALIWPEKKQHLSLTYKELLRPLGIQPSLTPPRLYITEGETREARALLTQQGYQVGMPLVGIHPGAAYGPAKSWPLERFQELVRLLDEKGDRYILLLGDSTMRHMAHELARERSSRVINVAGATSLRELAALLGLLSVLVSNDSGPMHMAAALGTPVVALFGSTDARVTGPYGQEEAVLQKGAHCSPCFLRVCPIDFRCMKGISADEVVERIDVRIRQSL